jgi:hypothetical protein
VTRESMRSSATGMGSLLLELVVGVWLLLLFVLALAWDPLDRRLGFHARRWSGRYGSAAPAADERGAYGIGGRPVEELDDELDDEVDDDTGAHQVIRRADSLDAA